MEMVAILIGVISTVIATVATWISVKALKEQRRIAKITSNITLVSQTHSMLTEYPELLELHNISKQEIQNLGLSERQLVYVIHSMTAGLLFYEVENHKTISINDLSQYRKNFLMNPIVELIWKQILRRNFMGETRFGKVVDSFYSSIENS